MWSPVIVCFSVPAKPYISISLHSRTNHASRRYFESNSLGGTIPAWLSELKLLQTLCVRPARLRPVPLGMRAVRVVHVRTSRLGVSCGARIRRAVGTAGRVRPSGREVVLLAYSAVAGAVACRRQRLVRLAAPRACAQLAEQ